MSFPGTNFRFHASIYLAYAAQNLKIKMSYPWDFFVNFLGTVTYGFLNIVFLWVLVSKVPSIAGWKFEELVFLYGIGELCFGFFSILFFQFCVRLSEHYIVEGHLDRLLVRPISPFMQLMMENLDVFDITILLKGSALVAWAWYKLGIPVAFDTIGSLALGLAIGTVIYLGLFLTAASLSFWLPDRGGMLMPLFSMSDVSRYPLTVYPLHIRLFFSYIIPFAYCAFYPAIWVLDKGDTSGLWLTMGVAASICVTVGLSLFHLGLARYESTGT